ncbi:MAG: glycerophosphodiester phosphodiesterase [bacterium]|nr:glycerophosphodiester phosphodiesterase [bacterium]
MTLRIGHRGAKGYEPENTVASFLKALELRVDMIELDVRLTRDKKLVVVHDAFLRRLTKTNKRVGNLTEQEIKKLRVFGKEKIPSLDEILDLAKGKTKINIELKGWRTAAVAAEILKRRLDDGQYVPDDLLISSFNWIELAAFHKLLPEIKIGMLFAGLPFGYAGIAKRIGAYSVHFHLRFTPHHSVSAAHRRKLKVFVWTVNKPQDIARMKAWGVDGIVSDYPDRI